MLDRFGLWPVVAACSAVPRAFIARLSTVRPGVLIGILAFEGVVIAVLPAAGQTLSPLTVVAATIVAAVLLVGEVLLITREGRLRDLQFSATVERLESLHRLLIVESKIRFDRSQGGGSSALYQTLLDLAGQLTAFVREQTEMRPFTKPGNPTGSILDLTLWLTEMSKAFNVDLRGRIIAAVHELRNYGIFDPRLSDDVLTEPTHATSVLISMAEALEKVANDLRKKEHGD